MLYGDKSGVGALRVADRRRVNSAGRVDSDHGGNDNGCRSGDSSNVDDGNDGDDEVDGYAAWRGGVFLCSMFHLCFCPSRRTSCYIFFGRARTRG